VRGLANSSFDRTSGTFSFVLRTNCVRDGQRISTRTIRRENGQPILGWCSFINGWYVAYEMTPKDTKPVKGFYAPDGISRTGDVFPTGLAVFDGYIPDEATSLKQIIQTSSHREVSSEVVDGRTCIKVKADHPTFGQYAIWLDPATDYLPRKLSVTKLAENRWNGHQLEDWQHRAPRGSIGKVSLKEMTVTVDSVVLDQASGPWEVVSWHAVRTEDFSDGNHQQTDLKGRRIEVHPDAVISDRDFEPDMASGAILANLLDPQLPKEWSAGGPRPWVDRSLVAAMDTTATQLRTMMTQRVQP
jgi:hypothetical protein